MIHKSHNLTFILSRKLIDFFKLMPCDPHVYSRKSVLIFKVFQNILYFDPFIVVTNVNMALQLLTSRILRIFHTPPCVDCSSDSPGQSWFLQ